MKALTLGKSTAVFGTAILLTFGTTACATKKYVRTTVSPVEARTSTLEKKSSDHASAIGELENNVSRTDEKATEANRNAQAAGQAAERANQAALEARNRADAAATASEQNANRIGEVSNQLGTVVGNIDNYQLVTTEAILFPLNKATLTKDAKAQLDQAVANIQNSKNFLLEIEGFTDRSGSRDINLALSQRRADAVVRYLTVNHQIPLRKIHVLGVGAENYAADNKTRAGRKQNRRVEMKVYALDLSGKQTAQNNMATPGSSDNQMRSRTAPDATTGRLTQGQQQTAPAQGTETSRP